MEKHPLNVWFQSTGKIVTSDSQQVTHYLLNGGKLNLTNDYDIFQELYAKYIDLKNCIVEKKTDIFKFFIDFDILSKTDVNINEYVICIQEILMNVYKDDNLMCIVTKADSNKEIIKNGITYYKQGFHLNYPMLNVDIKVALSIRKTIIVSLTNLFGKIEDFFDPWEKIVDKCVYENNGLRLIGSDKCSYSDGEWRYENRVYKLHSVYTGNKCDTNIYDFYSENTLNLVKDTSIRSKEISKTIYYDLPKYDDVVEQSDKPSGNFVILGKDNPERIIIEKFFKLHATGYRLEDLRTILKSEDKPLYLINTKSKYCQNKCDFHTNNHIYFKLTPKGLCQKCMSENEGIHGCCKDYESSYVPITTSLESGLKWKKPIKDENKIRHNFSNSSFLQNLENKFTQKDTFCGPKKKSGKQ